MTSFVLPSTKYHSRHDCLTFWHPVNPHGLRNSKKSPTPNTIYYSKFKKAFSIDTRVRVSYNKIRSSVYKEPLCPFCIVRLMPRILTAHSIRIIQVCANICSYAFAKRILRLLWGFLYKHWVVFVELIVRQTPLSNAIFLFSYNA